MRGRFLAGVALVVGMVVGTHGRPTLAAPVGGGIDSPAASVPTAPELLGWETIDLPGASCGRGAPFKYFFNRAPEEDAGLIIFLMGGGACLKEGPPPAGAAGIAAELHCMVFSNFTEPTDTYHLSSLVMPIFMRGSADNPYRGYHEAFIPYCTGDVHAGVMAAPHDYDPSPDAEFLVTHRGHLNVLAVLDDLATRLNGDRPVVLTGSSAGGFGAIFNYPDVVARWPGAVLVPDAGIAPPHPDTLMAREGTRVAARWGADTLLPSYCKEPACLADSMRLLAAHADHYDGDDAPWHPFGYIQGQQDGTLSDYLEITPCTYEQALRVGVAASARDNVAAFLPATGQHTFLAETGGYRLRSGVSLIGWLGQLTSATSVGELPADAVEPWLTCNPLTLPRLSR